MGQDTKRPDAELTREQIQAVINQKLENTIYWLNKAYDARPQDPSAEKTLLELMAALQRLKLEANETLVRKTQIGQPVRRQPQDSFRKICKAPGPL